MVLAVVGTIGVLISALLAVDMWWNQREGIRKKSLELTKLRDEKRLLLSVDVDDVLGAQRRYRDEILFFITEYREDSRKNRRTHNVLQSIIIAGSIAASTVTGAIGQQPLFKWLAVTLTLTVGIAAGFTGYFKFRERAMNQRQTADAIEHEFNAAELGIGRFLNVDGTRILALLAAEVEFLRQEQRKREQQLEQPAESRIQTE